jgi:flagellar assembly factor FliW
MTSQNALVEASAPPAPAIGIDEETVRIETRFGAMEFQLENAIYMPRGMLGYADCHDFGLASLPDPKLEQFKVLQSLEMADLSFVVAPLNLESQTIDREDIRRACGLLTVDPCNSVVLLVVSTRRIGATTQISVNVRAPVIVDTASRRAYQYVLQSNRYSVRQVIGVAGPQADKAPIKRRLTPTGDNRKMADMALMTRGIAGFPDPTRRPNHDQSR